MMSDDEDEPWCTKKTPEQAVRPKRGWATREEARGSDRERSSSSGGGGPRRGVPERRQPPTRRGAPNREEPSREDRNRDRARRRGPSDPGPRENLREREDVGSHGADRASRAAGDQSRRTSKQEELRTVVVANLQGMNLHRADLQEAFATAGDVERVTLSRDHALVTFKDVRSAGYAIRTFDGGKLGERTIDVYMHGKDGGSRGAGGGSGGGSDRARDEPARSSRQEPEAKRSRREEVPARSTGGSGGGGVGASRSSATAAAGRSTTAAQSSRGAAAGRPRSRSPRQRHRVGGR